MLTDEERLRIRKEEEEKKDKKEEKEYKDQKDEEQKSCPARYEGDKFIWSI